MKRINLMSAAVLASSVALAACGGRTDGDTTAAATEETSAPAAETAAAPAEAAAEGAVDFASLTGDAAAGQQVFALCTTCHAVEEGVNKVGPSLYAVVGRTAGSIDGFNYSEANASSGVTWTTDVLYDYLENPREFMPGTRMAFPGIKDPQDRANLIAYLEQQGS